MISDPLFYAVAIPAVILVGLGKGGFGGAMAMLGVPIMALTISPVAAAAILLPILLVMDAVSLVLYRRKFDVSLLKLMIPATTLGVVIGYFTASFVNDTVVRLLIGIMAVAFALNYWLRKAEDVPQKQPSMIKGWFFGTLAGFTSFVSHSGGPPYQIYTVPLRLDKLIFVGTSVVVFSYVNAIKLVPYFLLGQFNTENLFTSAVLLPLAPISTLAGVWLVKHISQKVFYSVIYVLIFLVGLKLIGDGMSPFFNG